MDLWFSDFKGENLHEFVYGHLKRYVTTAVNMSADVTWDAVDMSRGTSRGTLWIYVGGHHLERCISASRRHVGRLLTYLSHLPFCSCLVSSIRGNGIL